MNLKKYYNYFRIISNRWGIKIGLFSLYTEIRGENKYNIDSTAFYEVKELEVSAVNKTLSNVYQPANYYILEKALKFIRTISPQGHLVDFGCGMGRILAVAIYQGYRDVTGIEFASNLCRVAENNLENVRQRFPKANARIVCIDAADYQIRDTENIFTFFNPFKEKVLIQVIKNILASLKNHPRKVYVIYFTPEDKDIFLSAGFEELWFYQKMDYLNFSVLYRVPENDF